MQKIKEYTNLDENNLVLCVEHKIDIKSTFLFPNEELLLNQIRNQEKKAEFLQIRHLRNKTIGKIKIEYSSDRKPFLVDSNAFISISHSQNYVGILKADFDVGLDIEEISERVAKIKNRFLNEDELVIFGRAIEDLTKAWTIKEALFKLNNRKGIDFRKDLLIEEKTAYGFKCRMLDLDGWKIVKIKTFRKENLIISYNFEPSITV